MVRLELCRRNDSAAISRFIHGSYGFLKIVVPSVAMFRTKILLSAEQDFIALHDGVRPNPSLAQGFDCL
jgi:hypothetical protein